MKNISPVMLDGITYVAIALFGFLNAAFGSDEAAKHMGPELLFWLKTIFGALGAGALALKMYRSTTFAEYKQAKNGTYHTGDTQIIPNPNPPPKP